MNPDLTTLELDPQTIIADTGFAYTVFLPEDSFGLGDTAAKQRSSGLLLFEDDRPLGPPHARHDEIRQKGIGAYCHWYNVLYFSTSDGTDPRSNGRRYQIYRDRDALAADAGVDALASFDRTGCRLDHDEISFQVDYAIGNARMVIQFVEQSGLSLAGLRILELGPGPHFGTPLLLASCGAQVTLADRFLAQWDPLYHPTY